VLGGFENFDCPAGHRYACAGARYRFELLQNKTVERLGPVRRQIPVHQPVQLTHIGAGLDNEAAVAFLADTEARRCRVRVEFADDLAQDVLGRDEPLNVAVFVDDEGRTPLMLLKVQQLLVERCAFRDEVGFLHVL
jgi:hypothetical protein